MKKYISNQNVTISRTVQTHYTPQAFKNTKKHPTTVPSNKTQITKN